ncbi:MAG: hypothetical protein J7J09_00800 [Kosmotoga sp.]|uniref:hypothetical protein n=1 Tax=Kosmotoga sp. TaxID=1955248 RepID=UPI0025C4573C|nr:hypothetical protein [Kosmotoga sp.]MCD6159151.1 hypothetical protein [Kosmotoga sp.]
MIDKYFVYYLAMMVLAFSTNARFKENSILSLLPIAIVVIYFVGSGKLLPEKLRKRVLVFRERSYPLKDIDDAVSRLEKDKKLDLIELKKNINNIKKKLLNIAKVQRKLFVFSFILAPIFPVLTTFGSRNLSLMEKTMLLFSGYGGMLAVVLVSLAGINAFFKQVKRIADKIDSLEKD